MADLTVIQPSDIDTRTLTNSSQVAVRVSNETGNILSIKDDGLYCSPYEVGVYSKFAVLPVPEDNPTANIFYVPADTKLIEVQAIVNTNVSPVQNTNSWTFSVVTATKEDDEWVFGDTLFTITATRTGSRAGDSGHQYNSSFSVMAYKAFDTEGEVPEGYYAFVKTGGDGYVLATFNVSATSVTVGGDDDD